MRRPKAVYLAGPDRFLPDAPQLFACKRGLCEAAGLQVRSAPPAEPGETDHGELKAREIYAGALEALRGCDVVIANLTPWRGPNCDPGTAFELGFASALGKPMFAYMNVEDDAQVEYCGRVDAWIGATPDVGGVWRDPNGAEIEDFGLPETGMLWSEARRLYVVVTHDPLGDATGVELCLEALKLYVD